MTSAPLRMALYSHDAKGLEHLRRNLTLAHHLAWALSGLTGHDVTGPVVAGLAPGQEYRLPDGFDRLVLPGIKKSRGICQPQRLRITYEDLGEVRNALLSDVLNTFVPDPLIIDRHIYRMHQGLREPLTHLRRTHLSARIALGLREVSDVPATAQRERGELGGADTLRRSIDEIWVYRDVAVHDLNAIGEVPPALEGRTHYTGCLTCGRDIAESRDGPEASSASAGNALDPGPFVLMIAGGGYDDIHLLRAAAQVYVPGDYRHVVVTGPQLGAALFYQIAQAAGPRTVMCRSWPGISRHAQQAVAAIAMAGYNMVTEILASETPALLVSRETPRLEQFIRASGLKKAGAADLPRVTDLSVIALEDRLSGLLGGQGASHHQLMGRHRLRLDGLATIPLLVAELMDHRHDAPTTSPTYPTNHITNLTRMEIPA